MLCSILCYVVHVMHVILEYGLESSQNNINFEACHCASITNPWAGTTPRPTSSCNPATSYPGPRSASRDRPPNSASKTAPNPPSTNRAPNKPNAQRTSQASRRNSKN
jgi:hypothetical protein